MVCFLRIRARLILVSLLFPASAHALTPAEVFQKVAPSVWAVRALDAQERPFGYGSAVVIGPGQLVTNCHVLKKAKGIQLRRDNVIYEARLEHADIERDLCILSAKNFGASPVEIADFSRLSVGQRVYAIGNPEGFSLTLSEGLISGLRGEEDDQLIQTSAPISPGSSGGGLFDDQGRLVGITTLIYVGRARVAQNLNFAVPAHFIAEVPARWKEQQLARHAAGKSGSQPAAASLRPGMPRAGTTWTYSFLDKSYGRQRQYTVRVAAFEGSRVRESFAEQDGDESSLLVDPTTVRFSARRLSGDYQLVELAPYFFATELEKSTVPYRPAGYVATGNWSVAPIQLHPEEIAVPAGVFKAIRVDVTGSLPSGPMGISQAASIGHLPARFHYTAWYAAEVRRYVMVHHRTWNASNTLIGDEVIQLLQFGEN